CTPAAAVVCESDPFCCSQANGSWGPACIKEIRTVGKSLTCSESQGQCAHTLCSAGSPLQSGCDTPPQPVSCTAAICQVDPHCCQQAWDAACIDKVASVCGYDCM